MPELIRPQWPAPANVSAFTTTRAGGISVGPWQSLNLGYQCGDRPAAVRENRLRLRSWLPSEPSWLRQVHGARVIRHEPGAGPGEGADGMVTLLPGCVCAVLSADCLPVLLCDRAGSRVAAAHAGWRGLAAGIIEETVRVLDTQPDEIMAWLGPAIGPAAFEVGAEVRSALVQADARATDAFESSGEGWLADLYLLARQRLARLGVSRVYGGGFCTYDDPARFFSYRRDGVTGRLASVIWRE